MIIKPTASGHQLASTCPASAVLPHHPRAHTSADDGNDRHDLLRHALEVGQEKALEEASDPDETDWLENVWDDAQTLVGMADEVAFAHDVETRSAQLLGARLGRVYPPVAETAYVGTADYYRPAEDEDRVIVVDLKTGFVRAPHPRRNKQLHFLGLAAARWHGVPEATVGILQAPPGQRPWWRWHHLDAFALAEAEVELQRMHQSIHQAQLALDAGEMPRTVLGDHCAHCPARLSCPAQQALVRQMAVEPDALQQELTGMLTPATAAAVLQRYRAVSDAMKVVASSLHAFAELHGGIEVQPGVVWKQTTKPKKVLDGDIAFDALEELHGLEVAKDAVEKKTSQAGIERALAPIYEARKRSGEKVTKKALKEQALLAIRAKGGERTDLKTEWGDVDVDAKPDEEEVEAQQ